LSLRLLNLHLALASCADFELMTQQFTKGRLLKNTIKETKALLTNAEYYVKTMERTLERGSKYVRCQMTRWSWMLQTRSSLQCSMQAP
jgi:hypothetical protein